MRRICSVTCDVADEACEGNAAPHLSESYRRSVSREAVEADQPREQKQSQVARETQTSVVGGEDFCTEQERLSPDVAENTAADNADVTREEDDASRVKEDDTEADTFDHPQDIQCGSEVEVVEETRTIKGSEPEPEDPSERPGSVLSSSEPAVAATGAEALNNEGVGERDDDVGIREEKTEEAEEQADLKDKEAVTAKEITEVHNPEPFCSAEPDVDSSSIVSNHSLFIRKKRDDRVRKRESRSLRYLKVLQAFVVTQLKC